MNAMRATSEKHTLASAVIDAGSCDCRRPESMWTRFPTVILLIAVAAAHAQTEIAPDTWLIPGATPPDAQPDGNTVIIDAMPGLIVFDTGRHPAHTQQILDFATKAHAPIKAIINSHW